MIGKSEREHEEDREIRARAFCTNQEPAQRGGAVPDPVWVGSKWLLAFPRVPVTPGTSLSCLRCNRHSFLLSSYLSRICKIDNGFCSAWGHPSQDTSHSALSSYGLSAPLAFWRLFLSTTSGPSPGEFPGFWGSTVFCHAPIPRKGSGNNNNKAKFSLLNRF